MLPLTAVAAVVIAYLLGSINFAVIFSKVFIKKDIRNFGSGNAGMTNVMRVIGVIPGILTFICDALKGFAACSVGKYVFLWLSTQNDSEFYSYVYGAVICGVACIIGHIFPVFFGFKGGKGVATSVGIFAVCCPKAIIIGLTCFIIILLTVRIMSFSSLAATVIVIGLSLVFYDSSALFWPQAVCYLVIGVMIFVMHRENIVRLINGTEKRFTIKKG